MTGLLTIFRRELAGLFLGPLAWVLLCLALFVNGYWYTIYLELTGGDVAEATSLALGGSLPYWGFMIVVPPLLTMRMISEEARTGLLEFLLTAPVGDAAVVLGKLLAATVFMTLMWSSILVPGLVVDWIGTVPAGGTEWGPLLGGLFGSMLASGLFCAIGLVASAGTGTPIVAAFLAFVVNIGVLSAPLLSELAGVGADHWFKKAIVHFDVVTIFQGSFVLGAFDTAHVVFFVAWTGFFVFLATRLLEARRWRG